MKETEREERDGKTKKRKIRYTKKEENLLNSFPIFCPPTPNGTPVSSWKQIAEKNRDQSNGLISSMIVGQGGVPVKNLVTRISPMATDNYEKQGCPVFENGKGKNKQCLTEDPPGGSRIHHYVQEMKKRQGSIFIPWVKKQHIIRPINWNFLL